MRLKNCDHALFVSGIKFSNMPLLRKQMPVGYIFNGCAWPNPYSEQLESFQFQSSKSNERKTPNALFVVGSNDRINPPEGALRVKDALDKGGIHVEECNHEGGHAVPVKNDQALQEITAWISKILLL